jgi:RND family efflux transporter MFP subunit
MTKKKKRWIGVGVLAIVLAGGAVIAARSKEKPSGEKEMPFRVGKVQAEDLQVSVREVGVVDPVTKVDVKSVVSGRVLSLRVREGAVVKVGDVLAEIEPDVNQAQSLSEVQGGLAQAELKLHDAEREFASQKALFDQGLLGSDRFKEAKNMLDQAVETVRAARMRYQIVEDRGIPISGNAASQKARVTAPMSGVVIKRGVELGETVTSGVSSFNEGTILFTVADLKSLIIRVNLNEVDIAKVSVGQPVRVTLDAYPQKVFTGKVSFVAPSAELVEKIKVFKVEVSLDQLEESFRTGMSANVEILGEKREKAVSIPLEALQKRQEETVAYRLKENLKPEQIEKARKALDGRNKFIWLSENWKEYFEPVPVKAGIATLERVEVLAGLKPGQQVALEDVSRKKIEKDEDD